ncbi:MAG: hypothetical protein GY869_03890 [Planctomycetes bacterium]|nr:hypothetical protein [Planctomycetota bacterium]
MLHIGLRTLLPVGLCLVLWGCQDDGLDPFRTAGPGLFNPQMGSSREIIIVKCTLQPVELPADMNIYELPFWVESVAMAPDPISANAARLGFPPSQIQAWQDNGLIVKVAPMTYFTSLMESLVGAGGYIGDRTISKFDNPMQVADYLGYHLLTPVSLFVQGLDESVRSYELPQGNTVFRVNCQPWQINTQNRIMNMRISPELYSPMPMQVVFDEAGLPQPMYNPQKTVFEQITLSGLIPPDHFICISSKQPGPEAETNIGELFMKRDSGADNCQLVYIIMPKIDIARRVDKD